MPLSVQSPIFKRISEYIFRNDPQPGDAVATEDELIEALSITRYRARQALDILVQMGVLERHKRKGTLVKRLATHDMTLNILEQFKMASFDEIEFNEARLMIETAVLPFVMMRLTPARQAEMRQVIAGIRAHADSPQKADAYLRDFHLLLINGCGNRVMEVFANVVRTYFSLTQHLVENLPASFYLERARLCEELLAALAQSDLAQAARLTKEIINVPMER